MGDGQAYDVFVSYRHQEPDGPWVRGVLESVLTEHLGLEEGARRLVAVLREPCRPRLVAELRQPPAEVR